MRGRDGNILPPPPPPLPIVPRWVINTGPSPPQYCASSLEYLSITILCNCGDVSIPLTLVINTALSMSQYSSYSPEYLSTAISLSYVHQYWTFSTTKLCFFNRIPLHHNNVLLHCIGRPLIRLETLIVSPSLPVNGHFKNSIIFFTLSKLNVHPIILPCQYHNRKEKIKS